MICLFFFCQGRDGVIFSVPASPAENLNPEWKKTGLHFGSPGGEGRGSGLNKRPVLQGHSCFQTLIELCPKFKGPPLTGAFQMGSSEVEGPAFPEQLTLSSPASLGWASASLNCLRTGNKLGVWLEWIREASNPIENFLCWWKCSPSLPSIMVATSHMLLLSTQNGTSATEEMNFKF